VPESVALEPPILVNVTPGGSAPPRVIEVTDGGPPPVVTRKEGDISDPAVQVALFADVMLGGLPVWKERT